MPPAGSVLVGSVLAPPERRDSPPAVREEEFVLGAGDPPRMTSRTERSRKDDAGTSSTWPSLSYTTEIRAGVVAVTRAL
jgi:hypothetical protein